MYGVAECFLPVEVDVSLYAVHHTLARASNHLQLHSGMLTYHLQVMVDTRIAGILKNLHCSVCLSVLSSTVAAPCMHRFCQDCVEKV